VEFCENDICDVCDDCWRNEDGKNEEIEESEENEEIAESVEIANGDERCADSCDVERACSRTWSR
jgi:hypothetical protein